MITYFNHLDVRYDVVCNEWIAMNNNIAMGQTNATTTGDSGNTAKMHVDEALKALQSNDNSGAAMHIQEAQKNLS